MDVFANVTRRPFLQLAAEHRNVLLNPAYQKLHIDDANRRALRDGLIWIPSIKTGKAVTLAQWQTSIKDQNGRSTCYAFAAIAALEAAYRRQFGYYLNLSEQYAFHINKVSELHEGYVSNGLSVENNTSLWGFQGSSDIVDKMARFAVPVESICPYLSDARMSAVQMETPGAGLLNVTQEAFDAFEFSEKHIPTAARHACLFRVAGFQALPPNPSTVQIMAVISAGFEVVADIPGHCFLIIGYDVEDQTFIVKNSFGGTQFDTYDFDQPILAARYITSVHPPAVQRHAWWMGRWNMNHDGWRGQLVIRRWTNYRRADGEPTKLGSYYRDGKRYDVNGTTTNGGLGLQFWVAPSTDKIEPGWQFGQKFQTYAFTEDPYNGAGLTGSGWPDYGVTLRRAPIAAQPRSTGFDPNEWVGHWSLSVNGRSGRLDIWRPQPLAAVYRGDDGIERPVSGGLHFAFPHVLNAWVSDPPYAWPLYLCHNNWEIKIAAGTTTFGFWKRGVQAERVDRFALYGAIRAKWVQYGAFRGFLGEPVSDEMDWNGAPGGRCSYFQGGRIVWDRFEARLG